MKRLIAIVILVTVVACSDDKKTSTPVPSQVAQPSTQTENEPQLELEKKDEVSESIIVSPKRGDFNCEFVEKSTGMAGNMLISFYKVEKVDRLKTYELTDTDEYRLLEYELLNPVNLSLIKLSEYELSTSVNQISAFNYLGEGEEGILNATSSQVASVIESKDITGVISINMSVDEYTGEGKITNLYQNNEGRIDQIEVTKLYNCLQVE